MLAFLESLAVKTWDTYEPQILAAAQDPATAAELKAIAKRFAPRLQGVATALFPAATPLVAAGFAALDGALS